jgi:hypothetical protein
MRYFARRGVFVKCDENAINIHVGRDMAQVVSRRPLTAEDRVRARSVHVGLLVDKVALGQVRLRVLLFSPVSIIPPRLSIFIYHLVWPQFRDIVSPPTWTTTTFIWSRSCSGPTRRQNYVHKRKLLVQTHNTKFHPNILNCSGSMDS